MAVLVSLKSQNDPSSFLAATWTLVANITAHLDVPKHRRVKGGNVRFRSQLGACPGGVACMRALGFAQLWRLARRCVIGAQISMTALVAVTRVYNNRGVTLSV